MKIEEQELGRAALSPYLERIDVDGHRRPLLEITIWGDLPYHLIPFLFPPSFLLPSISLARSGRTLQAPPSGLG